jgi:hypothetical protein
VSDSLKVKLGAIRAALDAHTSDELKDILAFLFKEYVIDGPPPARATAALIDTRSELEGLSFAELISWLQTHLDVPELAQFEVQGGRVTVKVGGRSQPIEPPVARAPEPAAALAPSAAAAPLPSAPLPGARSPSAPPPSQGLTVRPIPGTPPPPPTRQPAAAGSAGASGAAPSGGSGTAPNAAPGSGTGAAAKPEEPAEPASRFSLLEVD